MVLPRVYYTFNLCFVKSLQSLFCQNTGYDLIYELSRLNDDYEVTAEADSRLTETSDEGRGFCDIAILWQKRIGAIPVSDIVSERFAFVRGGCVSMVWEILTYKVFFSLTSWTGTTYLNVSGLLDPYTLMSVVTL